MVCLQFERSGLHVPQSLTRLQSRPVAVGKSHVSFISSCSQSMDDPTTLRINTYVDDPLATKGRTEHTELFTAKAFLVWSTSGLRQRGASVSVFRPLVLSSLLQTIWSTPFTATWSNSCVPVSSSSASGRLWEGASMSLRWWWSGRPLSRCGARCPRFRMTCCQTACGPCK